MPASFCEPRRRAMKVTDITSGYRKLTDGFRAEVKSAHRSIHELLEAKVAGKAHGISGQG
jgi:hypothetical protein